MTTCSEPPARCGACAHFGNRPAASYERALCYLKGLRNRLDPGCEFWIEAAPEGEIPITSVDEGDLF